MDTTWYRIDQVAARTGLTKRTLRYYEEIGLLPPAARTEGNYRLYTDEDVQRLEKIVAIKETLGLTLAEIIEFIAFEEQREGIRTVYMNMTEPAEQLQQLAQAEIIVQQQLQFIAKKIEQLTAMQTSLEERQQRYQRLTAELAPSLAVSK